MRFTLLFLSLLIFYPLSTFASKGIVTHKLSYCDYFLVETEYGFALLEWHGGNDPDKGDIIVGEFEEYGIKDIFNITDDEEITVWVEDYFLSKENALERFYEFCE